MGGRVFQLICLVVPSLEGDEDSEVVLAGGDFDGGTGELGADLIVSPRMDSFFRAADVEGADWRVMRRLFGQVGYPNGRPGGRGGCLDDRDRRTCAGLLLQGF